MKQALKGAANSQIRLTRRPNVRQVPNAEVDEVPLFGIHLELQQSAFGLLANEQRAQAMKRSKFNEERVRYPLKRVACSRPGSGLGGSRPSARLTFYGWKTRSQTVS